MPWGFGGAGGGPGRNGGGGGYAVLKDTGGLDRRAAAAVEDFEGADFLNGEHGMLGQTGSELPDQIGDVGGWISQEFEGRQFLYDLLIWIEIFKRRATVNPSQ